MRFYPLEKLINMDEGYVRYFKIDHHNLLLFEKNQQRYLIESYCPHRDQRLSPSCLVGEELVCPSHHYRFSVNSGQLNYYSEEKCRDLRVYPLVYEGSEIGFMMADD